MSSYKPLYKPLLKRPADAFYFIFLGSHLAASLLLDAQALLPKTWFPLFFRETLTWFLTSTNDPLFRNGPQPWLKSFLWCELCIQCPVFVAGMIGLAKDDKRSWPLLLAYSAHAATTTLACLATVFADEHVTKDQLTTLLASYAPYFIIPAIMCLDMLRRLMAEMAASQKKAKRA